MLRMNEWLDSSVSLHSQRTELIIVDRLELLLSQSLDDATVCGHWEGSCS
jgi:hypothetical protein